LVGGFHLPSAVCPPSVFGETPSDRVRQQPRALDGPGAQSFMTHNPHRGGRNWSVASAFRPTFVRLRSSPGGWRRREWSPSCRLSRPDARRSLAGHPQVGTNADKRRSARRRPCRRRRPHRQSAHSRPASRINLPVGSWAFGGRNPEFGPNRDWRVPAPLGSEVLISNKSPMRCPKSFGGLHLPTVAVPPSDRRRSTFRPSPLHLW